MKRRFVRKLKCQVEVELILQIEDPLDTFWSKRSKQEPQNRVPIRQMKRAHPESIENLNPKIEMLPAKVSITMQPIQKVNEPCTPREIQIYALSGVSSEISYMKTHFENAIKESIELLVDQCHTKNTQYYKLAPEEEAEFEDAFDIPDDYKVSKEWGINKISGKSASFIRKRLNPENKRRDKKSVEKIKQDKQAALEMLKKAFQDLLVERRARFTKSEIAEKLRLCSNRTTKTRRTAFLNTWLRGKHITSEEFNELRELYEKKKLAKN